MTTTSIYEMALANAVAELQSMTVEFERLAKRKLQLEAFIANTQALIGEPKQKQLGLTVDAEQVHDSAATKDPLWKSISLAINGKGGGFTVKDAQIALDRIGRPVTSPNKNQIVRNALVKSDFFTQIGPGLFAIKEVNELKEVPEGTS
jgi:hypothetical protein